MALETKVVGPPKKPRKPYPDFPLFPHATKRWAKKIRGKLHYFGPWADPQAALKKYTEQRDDLHSGRTPRVSGEGLTLRDLANRFLTAKQQMVNTGELAPRTFADYYATCSRLMEAFGKSRLVVDLAADDFLHFRGELAKTRGPAALGVEIQRVRVAFKFAYDNGLIDSPVRYGTGFRPPTKKVLRAARQAKGERMFQPHELRMMLAAAAVQLKAMILLGINCGFGNNDVATLPIRAVDFAGGWVNFPRPKTAVARRNPLWPETIEALKAQLSARSRPHDPADDGLLFLTKFGHRWAQARPENLISQQMTKLLRKLGLHRPGLNFYALRHTFETIGGESRDQVAVDALMGHSRDDMASVYRERISDERLVAVTELVRGWLFAKPKKKAK